MSNLEKISGAEVSGVLFIRDYIEIQFDWLSLQFMTDPRVVCGGNSYAFPNPSSFAQIIALINQSLISYNLKGGIYEFTFSNGTVLEADQYGGPDGETFFVIDRQINGPDRSDLF